MLGQVQLHAWVILTCKLQRHCSNLATQVAALSVHCGHRVADTLSTERSKAQKEQAAHLLCLRELEDRVQVSTRHTCQDEPWVLIGRQAATH